MQNPNIEPPRTSEGQSRPECGPPRWLNANILKTQEAAELLRVSPDTIRTLVNAGVLPCVRINSRNWRFRRIALERWLEHSER